MSVPPANVNLTARINADAKFAFEFFCLDLNRAGFKQKDYEVLERLCFGLEEKQVRIVLAHALTEVSLKKPMNPVYLAARIAPTARTAFDGFALELRQKHPEIHHDYQVLQGLCFALQLPYVQAVLNPLMKR